MPRQEISSVFSDGLIMDLNPINTPKSVLTDCLNGTYITYNGNEFVLQNDMGNYKLKNCKLPTNFIPVGVKGYADILYIVSYNPFTKEVEIGSYPAPQSIFTTSNEENKVPSTDEELAPFNWPTEENESNTRQYPELIKNDKKPLFIFAGSDEETYKLNPGDEFKLEGLNSIIGLEYIYQHLNFYVIDEDNKLYDLDDNDMYFYNGEKWNGDTMRKVFWETPGWLAAQYNLYVPDKFNLNLRSLNVPEFLVNQSNDEVPTQVEDESLDELQPEKGYFKVSMDLSSQTIITDKLFQKELNNNLNKENTYKHLYIRYLIKQNRVSSTDSDEDYGTFKGIVVTIDNNTSENYKPSVRNEDYVYCDIPVWKHNYQDDIITAYNNIKPIWFYEKPKIDEKLENANISNYRGIVEITAYPIIKYKGNDIERTLEYTQFKTTQRFPLNALKNSNKIEIANTIYKWSVDNDSCTVSFNINGPFINSNNIKGSYEIRKINLTNVNTQENTVNEVTLSEILISDAIPNLTLFGQNTLNIPLKNGGFEREGGMYCLNITLYQNESELKNVSLLLIPSKVFNSFFGRYDSFNNITPKIWVSKYLEYVNIKNILFSNFTTTSKIDKSISWIDYKWSDENTWKPLKYNKNQPSLHYTDTLSKAINKLYNEKFYNKTNDSSTPNWATDSVFTANLQFKIKTSVLLNIKCNSNFDIDTLEGNLWNPKYNLELNLKQGNEYKNIKVSTKDIKELTTQLDLSDYILEFYLNSNFQSTHGYIEDAAFKTQLPFYDYRNEAELTIKWTSKDRKPQEGLVQILDAHKERYRFDATSDVNYTVANGNLEVWTSVGNIMQDYPYAKLNVGIGGADNRQHPSIFYKASVDNKHSVGQEYWTSDQNNVGIVFKAYNKAQGKNTATCIMNTSSVSLNTIEKSLWILCIRKFSNEEITVFFPRIKSVNEPAMDRTISINKADINFFINTLSYDNFKLFDKTLKSFTTLNDKIKELKIDTNHLLDNDNDVTIESTKTIYNYNIDPNQLINIDLEETVFKNFINDNDDNGLNYWISNSNNKEVDVIIDRYNKSQRGIFLDVLTDKEINEINKVNTGFKNNIIGYDVELAKKLKDNLSKLSSGGTISSTNLEYQNKTNYVIRAIKTKNGALELVKNTSAVDFMYNENISLD